MKRLVLLLVVLLALFVPLTFTVAAVHAQPADDDLFNNVCEGVTDATVCAEKNINQTQQNNALFGPSGILTRVAQLLTVAVGIASVIMIIVGGIKFVASAGDSSKTTTARNTIIYALVGLFVAILAQSIIIFVLNRI